MAESRRKVLVAVDGSEESMHAFNWYCENVCKSEDDCLILNVTEFRRQARPEILSDPEALVEQLKQSQEATAKMISGFADEMRQRGIKGTAYAVPGYSRSPAEEILDIAESKKVDLIVIGTQGLGKTSTSDFGTVCISVLRFAKCPVIITRPNQNETNQDSELLYEESVESR